MARSIFDGAFGPAAANPLAVLAASCLVGLLATTFAPRAGADVLALSCHGTATSLTRLAEHAPLGAPRAPAAMVRVAKTVLDMRALSADAFADWPQALR